MENIDEIFGFMESNNFGILITINNSKITGTHIPFILKREEGTSGKLYCHISKANSQWKNISGEVLVIFPGAHKYISSSWYETDQSVPTWNYLSVHAYGNLKITEEMEHKIRIIRELVEYFEPDKSRYSLDNLESGYFEKLMKGIVVFEIEISTLEGKEKLSQNHSSDRQKRIIEHLENEVNEDGKIISELMKRNLHKNSEPGSSEIP